MPLNNKHNSHTINQLRGCGGVIRYFSAYYTTVCVLFLLFASQHVQAQDVDSLYAVFSVSRGATRIVAANEIMQYVYENDYFDPLTTLKTDDDEAFILATVYDAMGAYFSYEKENFVKSTEFYRLSLVNYEKIGDAGAANLINGNIGSNYGRTGDYENAVAYMMKCYEWEKSVGDSEGLGSTLNNLGVIYSQWDKPDMAIRFFEEAEVVERPLNRPMNYANRLAQLAREYSKIENAPKALQLIKEALQYDEKIESQSLKESRIATHQTIMGDIYAESDSLANAADCYQKALVFFETNEQHYYLATTLLQLGRLQVKAKRYGEAIDLFQRCEKIAEDNLYLRIRRDVCLLLGETYNKLALNPMSYFYLHKYTILNDSIFNEASQQQINDFQVKYDTQQKELEIVRQQAEIAEHRRRITLLIIIAVSLTALAVVLLVANRKIHRKNIAITRRILENRRAGNVAAAAVTPANKAKATENALFLKIEQYLHTNKRYLNENIDRTALAVNLKTNETYIAKAIRDSAGMTINEYINSLRLAHACDLLSDPAADHIKMESIATDCGFNNRISFYRCFVAKYDISPNAFRKLARK